MVKLEDDYILRADVEYTIIGVIATLILPCVLFNIFIIMWVQTQGFIFDSIIDAVIGVIANLIVLCVHVTQCSRGITWYRYSYCVNWELRITSNLGILTPKGTAACTISLNFQCIKKYLDSTCRGTWPMPSSLHED